MNLEAYKTMRAKLATQNPTYRLICRICNQPDFTCYCSHICNFDPKISFVILIHPVEARRRIATGRMSHLCLENSYLIKGQNFTQNKQVNFLLADPQYASVILYPGATSENLSLLSSDEKRNLTSVDKKLRVFVIDGTWATAGKMVRESDNLKKLPRICFSPPKPSSFRVRKQPHANCYSTIEAIHQTIELIGDSQGFSVVNREHDRLLMVFDSMVERQLSFIQDKKNYRRENRKSG
jgi:DTW domain-containing protein